MRGRRPWLALLVLLSGSFMILVDTTVVNIAIPVMLSDLDAGLNEIIWVTNVYLLSFAVPLLLSGRLGDRFGPKRVFLVGLVVFTVASAVCGLAPDTTVLIAARAVQGLGAAAMAPQPLPLITFLFADGERGTPIGFTGTVAAVATISGPLIGGLLVSSLGWEWIFFVNVPIGVAAFALITLLVPDFRPERTHRLDLVGTVVCCAALSMLVFGIQEGERYGWGVVAGPVTIPRLLVAGAILLAVFVIWQRLNPREPLLNLRLLVSRNFSMGTVASLAAGFAMTGFWLAAMLYLQSALGLSPLAAALVSAPSSLASAIVAPLAGRLSDRVSGKWVAASGFVIHAIAAAAIAIPAHPDLNPMALVPGFVLIGIGGGALFGPVTNIAIATVEPHQVGTGSGTLKSARHLGGVIGAAVVGGLIQARLAVELPARAASEVAVLPAELRTWFLDRVAGAVGPESGFDALTRVQPPTGISATVRDQLTRALENTFSHGLAAATKPALTLIIIVLLLGAAACLAMIPRRAAEDADVRQPPVPSRR